MNTCKASLRASLLAYLVLAAVARSEAARATPAKTSGKPNVVIIMADDLGWGDISAYHAKSLIKTPHVDRLTTQGLSFTDAHSSASVCTPSRYGLLTGRYCWRTVLKKQVLGGYSPLLIESDRPTMPGMFQNAGYKTAGIGKWHLGLDWQRKDPAAPAGGGRNVDFSKPVVRGANACGFDYSFITAACAKIDAPHVFIENGSCTVAPTRWYDVRGKGRDNSARTGFAAPDFPFRDVDRVFVEKSVAFIAANKDQPFFLYLPLSAPHAPFWPADFAEEKTHSKRGDLVWQVDWCVGQIDACLQEHGLAEIAEIFSRGVKIEVGDMLPSSEYADRLTRVPPAWERAFEVNASADPAIRASCVEFVLAGLYASEQVSRSQRHGRIVYEIP